MKDPGESPHLCYYTIKVPCNLLHHTTTKVTNSCLLPGNLSGWSSWQTEVGYLLLQALHIEKLGAAWRRATSSLQTRELLTELDSLRRRIVELECKLKVLAVNQTNCISQQDSTVESQEVATASYPLTVNSNCADIPEHKETALVLHQVKLLSDRDSSLEKHVQHSHRERLRQPELSTSLKLTWEVADNWHNIGALLKIPNSDLKCIKKDYGQCRECLREMLSVWLNQPHPTWKQLAEAVELSNPDTAKRILAEQQ